MSDSNSNSYGQILKSSSIMGSVAIVTLFLGMIRTKFAAVLIGTAGVGLAANFTAIQSLIGGIAGLGIQSSAVREVAAAYANGDNQIVGETVLTLRRICWLTGLLGAVSTLLLSALISQLTFSSNEYQWDIAAIGLIIFFANLSNGQTALLQGARKIRDMAKTQVISAMAGTLVTIGFYFWLGPRGIIPALVLMAIIQLGIAWHFARRVPVPKVTMTWRESLNKAGAMVRLGVVIMSSGLVGSIVAYATAALITKQINVQALGIYSAAFALSGIFVNFVLNAMSADYYPRLTGLIGDPHKTAKAVREQSEIALLLALPGLAITTYAAPWIVELFYSSEFALAADLISIFILGCYGRVVAWPMGHLVLAFGKGMLFLGLEIGLRGTQILLTFIWLPMYGLDGVAWAFALTALINIPIESVVAKRLTGYSWDARKFVRVAMSGLALFILSLNGLLIESWDRHFLSLLIVLIVSLFCARGLLISMTDSSSPSIKKLLKILDNLQAPCNFVKRIWNKIWSA